MLNFFHYIPAQCLLLVDAQFNKTYCESYLPLTWTRPVLLWVFFSGTDTIFFKILKGARGEIGPQGDRGFPGAPGQQGNPGTPGADGEMGPPVSFHLKCT